MEIEILRLLRKNPRISFFKLSRQTKMSVEKILQSYSELLDTNVIRPVSLINFSKFRYFQVILVLAYKGTDNSLMKYLFSSSNVNNAFLTDSGVVVHVVFSSLADYDSFIEEISNFGIVGLEEHFIEQEMIREGFCP